MALDPQLAGQLRQILSVEVSSGTANSFGEIQVGSVATLFCRLENRTRSVERSDGTFDRSPFPFVVIDASTSFTPTMATRVWLPGNSPSTAALARKLTSIEPVPDEMGNLEHWELSL